MPKSPPGMYVPLDVNYMRDPRIRRAGTDAEVLYVRALAYAKGGGTDGIVHDYDIEVIAVGLKRVAARIAALVREKAWEERDGGWFIAGWFKWNEPTATLRERKAKQSKGAEQTNHQKHHVEKGEFSRSCALCLDGVT